MVAMENTGTKQITIILVEDHSLMRQGIRNTLEQVPDMEVIGEAEDGQQGVELIEKLKPDIALMDIRLPKLNGIAVVRRIKETAPHTKALMLSAYDDDDYILALMEIGAWGYLLKTTKTDVLIEAIRSVHAGEPVLDPAVAARVARLWASHNIESSGKKTTGQLSSRELEILELAARGLRNKDIATQLNLSVRTVEGHFASIFNKLNLSSRVEAIMYALSQNLIVKET